MPSLTATQSAEEKLTGLARLHVKAKQDRSLRFSNLLHHITPEMMEKAYKSLNRQSVRGVDQQSWEQYGRGLPARLLDLHQRIHTGQYKPQPVLRLWLPKPNGEKRPIGITAVEDKVVQQAMVWVLEAIYEVDFLGFSYGFRPKRNQHMALDAVYVAISQRKVSWILDADISQFFDTIDHSWLMRFLQHRIADKRLLNLIERTIKAGVVDEGRYAKTVVGTPQGAVISPLLANIYLHYVLDLWANQWRKRNASGECYIVRYADDTVLGFQYRADGERFNAAFEKRLGIFGLELNRSKTKLLEFGRFAASNRRQRQQGKPECFVFLGLTHICSTRRSDGGFAVKRITSAKKMTAKLKDIRRQLFKNRSKDVYAQASWLKSVVQGHNNYYAVPGNLKALNAFRSEICRSWLKALRRRGQRHPISWKELTKVISLFIPSASILHPYPNMRLRV
jgi:RNA-directed DNA polymerase